MKRQKSAKKLVRYGLCAAAILAMLGTFTGCGSFDEYEDYDDNSSTEQGAGLPSRSSVTMRLAEDDTLQIERPVRETIVPMGEEGTWTIFVYLCGTDLESGNGMATMDMQEMLNASTGENVRFVVQTGGTDGWDNDFVDSNAIQRFVISQGEITLADERGLGNMGDSNTLADFLNWGVGNYPAAHMGLVLWNHGGGSISGVCFDELNDSDSLSLRELDAALLSVYDSMTDNFEFIGFDACLMGSIECANVLASYADYMYGSEELEPGYGWDYQAIGDYLGENPTATGAELGEKVADSFYDCCDEIGEGDSATFSIVDLAQIDSLLESFHTYSQNLYQVTEDTEIFSEVVRNAMNADNYGGNNKSEGYTNMVDLAGVVDAGSAYVDGAEQVLDSINQAVIYKRNGAYHEYACGLSTYYPLQIQGSNELEMFGQIAVSPYYLSFVDRAAYGAVNMGDTSDYDNSEMLDLWGIFDYLFSDDNGYYEEDTTDSDYWSYYDSYEQTGESSLIEFDTAPYIDENGSYGFVLTQDALYNTASVQANVYMLSEDGADLIELGVSSYIYMDWENGEFSDNFDGSWYSLPDGQNLAVYIVSENDGYDVYTSPILLNGEETNLRITHDYTNGTVTIDGIWSGIDDNGMAGRELEELELGDVITPMYYATAVDSDEEYYYYGAEYSYDGNSDISFRYLMDGQYYYGFSIDDVYGDYYITDFVQFDVEGDTVYYYTE